MRLHVHNYSMRNPYAIYMVTRPRARACIFHKTLSLMLYLVGLLSSVYIHINHAGAFLEIEAGGCSRVQMSNGAAHARPKFTPPH